MDSFEKRLFDQEDRRLGFMERGERLHIIGVVATCVYTVAITVASVVLLSR